MSTILKIQKMLYDCIKDDKYLAELKYRMYAYIPDNTATPYVCMDKIKFSQLSYRGQKKHYKGTINMLVYDDTIESNKQCILTTDHIESLIHKIFRQNNEELSTANINTVGKTITQDNRLNWYGNLEFSMAIIEK